jgi:CheY-like chemotaxis protein
LPKNCPCNGVHLTLNNRQKLELMHTSSIHLGTVINHILDFSKIESGKMLLVNETFSVVHLIEEVAEISQSMAKQKGLGFTVIIDPLIPKWVIGDEGKLKQVLFNLTNNALKFTQKGTITLRAQLQSERLMDKKTQLTLLIEDTGIGIPAEKLTSLFDAFSQVDNSLSRSFNGTGLGLAISKQLMHLMGGEISVQSIHGQGSTFQMQIGLIKGESLPTPPPSKTANSLSLSILLVEDEMVSQMVARGFLEESGHQVELAENGPDAIKLAENNLYDIILMDLRMPGMNGLEATRRIRKLDNPLHSQVPIVALTADVVKDTLQECLNNGMQRVLTKPIVLGELNRTFQEVLSPNRI